MPFDMRPVPPGVEATGDAAEVAASAEVRVKKVLIVDDEPGIRHFCALLLSSYGYKTIESASGPEALSLAQHAAMSEAIDMVVTDIVMPGMDGVTLAEHFAELFPDTPVVLMSGCAKVPPSRLENLNARWAFLAKPFGPRTLIEAVRSVLGEGGGNRAA